jgi:3-oxoacyl-(acyl-carrier-protein) synthase
VKPNPAIAVTGLGVCSPLGLTVEDFWSATLAGAVATDELVRFDTSGLSARRGAEVRGLEEVGGAIGIDPVEHSRAVTLAEFAARNAARDASIADAGADPKRVGVVFGTVMATRPAAESWLARDTVRGPWLSPSELSRGPARALGYEGPNCVLAAACAAGNSAIAYAAQALRAGRADAMVAGGADELSQAMLLMFDSFRALAPDAVRPFDRDRRGLMLAEGAAALMLERETDARARGARIYGRVLGYANLADAHHITAPDPRGRGAVRSMRAALRDADADPCDVDHISAHGTGTPSNDAVEACAIREVFGPHTDHLPVSSLKGAIGHAQGAASAIEAVGCLLAIRDGVVPATANHRTPDPACELDVVAGAARHTPLGVVLSNAFGFGGSIECVAFGAP